MWWGMWEVVKRVDERNDMVEKEGVRIVRIEGRWP